MLTVLQRLRPVHERLSNLFTPDTLGAGTVSSFGRSGTARTASTSGEHHRHLALWRLLTVDRLRCTRLQPCCNNSFTDVVGLGGLARSCACHPRRLRAGAPKRRTHR